MKTKLEEECCCLHSIQWACLLVKGLDLFVWNWKRQYQKIFPQKDSCLCDVESLVQFVCKVIGRDVHKKVFSLVDNEEEEFQNSDSHLCHVFLVFLRFWQKEFVLK